MTNTYLVRWRVAFWRVWYVDDNGAKSLCGDDFAELSSIIERLNTYPRATVVILGR